MSIGAAVVGVGETPFTALGTPATSYDITCDAARLAIADAGLETREIDGIVKYSVDGAMSDTELGTHLGIEELTFSAEIPYGGGSAAAVLATAGAAVATSQAKHVLCYRTVVASEWWNQLRHLDIGRPYYRDALEFLRPLGWYSYHHLFGMLTQRHILDYGTSPEQFGEVILQSRRHAMATPTALRRDPLTIEEYLESPFSVEPLRLADDVIWGNGGCAVVVAGADAVSEAPNGGAHIAATAQAMGTPAQVSFEFWAARANIHASATSLAHQLFAKGLRAQDIGSLQCYDTMPVSVALALEGFGFCDIGEAGAYIGDGHIGADGTVAVCTNGGHTSCAYIHGFSQVLEAVRRVRRGPGSNAADAFSLVAGSLTTPTSAAILSSDPWPSA